MNRNLHDILAGKRTRIAEDCRYGLIDHFAGLIHDCAEMCGVGFCIREPFPFPDSVGYFYSFRTRDSGHGDATHAVGSGDGAYRVV